MALNTTREGLRIDMQNRAPIKTTKCKISYYRKSTLPYKCILAAFIIMLVPTYNNFAEEENSMLKHADEKIQSITGFIETSNAQIWYKKFYTSESEHKIPMIALHGGPGFSHHSMLALKNLAPYNPVILYDQSGCGNSKMKDPTFHNWTLEHFLQELNEFINALGHEKIYLLGCSWGGTLAAKYASGDHGKLAGLILASPLICTAQWVHDCKKLAASLPGRIDTIIEKHEAENTMNAAEYQDAVSVFYTNFLCRMDPWPSDLLDSIKIWNTEIYKTMWGPCEMTSDGNLKDLDLTPELKKINVPTLITCGRFDMATPETMQNYAKLIPNAKLVIFEKSSHVAFAEEPEKYIQVARVLKIVLDFRIVS